MNLDVLHKIKIKWKWKHYVEFWLLWTFPAAIVGHSGVKDLAVKMNHLLLSVLAAASLTALVQV